MTDTSWGVVARAWLVFEDATGHRQGFEIPRAEVEFQYDCDVARTMFGDGVPVNRRWQWKITTHHEFTVYEPAPTDHKSAKGTRQIDAAPGHPATQAISEQTRENNSDDGTS
jgi:hypothetical protein